MSQVPAERAPAPDGMSWWFQEAIAAEAPSPATTAPAGKTRADVVVVGGGFTGLWTALRLRERAPHLSVTLIEGGLCGSGASGKNGGKVHGYWGSLATIVANFGADKALEIARLGSKAQDMMRNFATAPGRDVWWREAGNLRAITTDLQETKAQATVAMAKELGVPESVVALSREELACHVRSPVFRGGLALPEGANVQPARLARALRSACLKAGVVVWENTPMIGIDEGSPCRVRHSRGEIMCDQVVLATNIALAGHPRVARSLALFSSYAVMTGAIEDMAERLGWHADQGLADLRMFVHYFRKARQDRLLMGSGSGPIAFGAQVDSRLLTHDQLAADRALAAIRRFFPQLGGIGLAKSWGGGIDISPDRLPFFVTTGSGRVHLGAGYSGHGVNATRIGGECLSGLVLGVKDEWTLSPFCTRTVARFPAEPFRTWGGRVVRSAILGCEDAEEYGQRGTTLQRAGAALPKMLGIKVGTR